MALKFKPKGAPQTQAPDTDQDDDPTPTKSTVKTSPKKSGGTLSWMKKGAAAKELMEKEEARAEAAKAEYGKMWRYWMPPGADRQITFLDGDLDEDGILDIIMFKEHTVLVNGDRKNFICTDDESETAEPCPICARGDSKPMLVGVMTIIDHEPHTIKSGKNAGQVIENQRKLFVAKKTTIKKLTKIAIKRGGLAGCTFDVSRSDDKTASVGDTFDYVSKTDLSSLADKLGLKPEDVAPADYAHELTYHTADELVDLGVGKAPKGPGYGGSGQGAGVDKKSLKSQL